MLTSTSERVQTRRPRPSYATFVVCVTGIRRLSRSFVRITFTGDELEHLGTTGLDQRVKLVLPLPGVGVRAFPNGHDWYAAWRRLPEHQRNPIRTYTLRAVRPERREFDIDFVLHDDAGPATVWVRDAQVGDEVAVVGPDARGEDPYAGVAWRPVDAHTVLLAGDETAAPAICSVLATLAPAARGCAIIEVPDISDIQHVHAPEGVRVTWLPRTLTGTAHGEALSDAVRTWTAGHLAGGQPTIGELTDVDIEHGILWEVPETVSPGDGLYAWLAGEAGVIKTLRRYLVTESGIDRNRVAFMGYWRAGRAELA
jgi:NADPH-dependent ferric siderophore reductase